MLHLLCSEIKLFIQHFFFSFGATCEIQSIVQKTGFKLHYFLLVLVQQRRELGFTSGSMCIQSLELRKYNLRDMKRKKARDFSIFEGDDHARR